MTDWTMKRVAACLRDGTLIGGAVFGVLSVLSTVMWMAFGKTVLTTMGVASAKDIDDLKVDISQVNENLTGLTNIVLRVTGEDQVARVDVDRSYVIPPVHKGEDVQLNLNLSRTERGMECTFLGGSSIFEDISGGPEPGSPLRPIVQLGDRPQALTLRIEPPEDLTPGRVLLSLELRYDCDGEVEYQRTRAIAFELLPARGAQ